MSFLINIGLLNNPYDMETIPTALADMGISVINSTEGMGEFEGDEPTFVAELNSPEINTIAELGAAVDRMCEVFTQRCIPVMCAGTGYMFGPDASKYPFSPDYFLMP